MMRLIGQFYLLLFALFLVGPIVVIGGVSLNAKQKMSFPPDGIGIGWFVEIFANPEWSGALVNSLVIALCSAALAVLIALPIAYTTWKHGLRYAKALLALGIAPFILPPIILALAVLLFFTTINFNGFMINVIIAHAIFLVALPLVTISLGLEGVDRSLMEAAQTMGADERTVFRTVIFPIAAPYAMAGFAFCFVLSLNEYIIALMTVGFTVETLPIKIFNALRYGYTPIIAAIAVMFLIINIVIFSLIARLGNLPRILGAFDE